MYKERKVTTIIAAAGVGKRFGGDIPKQFMTLESGLGKDGTVLPKETVLERAIGVFEENKYVDSIVIVTGEEFLTRTEELTLRFSKLSGVVRGGKERQDSIYAGLKQVTNGRPQADGGNGPAGTANPIVLVHDAARPFVTQEVVNAVIEAAYEKGAAIPCVNPKDTIRTKDETLNRAELHIVQTPQGFDSMLLRKAYEKAYEEGFYGTDDASLVERLGEKVAIVSGDYENKKITTPEDLPGAGHAGGFASIPRVGSGFDVHKLVEGRKCILGGVDIPNELGLLGHSDADVLLHAIMDALLGAAAMGDIGRHFPDTDPKYEGISSLKLLEHVKSLLDDAGYTVGNIDATVICQRPKILPYVPEMRANVAKALGIDVDKVNIKGTTTEKLGFTGRGEGIASEAVAIIYRR